MHLDSHFLLSAVYLLIVATVAVALFNRLGLGSILGLLTAGIAVGPYSVGPVLTEDVEGIRRFTELGVVLLLFLIGTELRPARLWSMRREVFGLGALQVLIAWALIAAVELLYLPTWQAALLAGMTLALSSTALVMQILHERGETASPHGTAAFSVLLMQDLAVVPLLALVSLLSDRGTLPAGGALGQRLAIALAMLSVLLVFGRYIVPWVLDRLTRERNREGVFLAVMLSVFLSAWAMEEAGLSMALGAFLMGMLLSRTRFQYQIQAQVEPYKGLMMSLFFVAVGMSIDLNAVIANPLWLAQQVLLILLIKILVILALGIGFGLGRATTVRLAFLLAQVGEFGFVLLGTGNALGVISDDLFVLGASVISVSMLVTPLLNKAGNALAVRLSPPATPGQSDIAGLAPSGHVVIAGYGRVGHSIAVLLHQTGVPILALDNDPARVSKGVADGLPVYFGDIGDPHLLRAIQIQRAALAVLTVDNPRTALRALHHLRNECPDLPVIARAKDLEGVGQLMAAGATSAFPEILESSLRLGAEALRIVGVAGDDVERLVTGVRSTRYEAIR